MKMSSMCNPRRATFSLGNSSFANLVNENVAPV